MFINKLITALGRSLEKGSWFLDGASLIEFVVNRRLSGKIYVGCYQCDVKSLKQKLERIGLALKHEKDNKYSTIIEDIKVRITIYSEKEIPKDVIYAPKALMEDRKKDQALGKNGLWYYLYSQIRPYKFPIPYKTGSFLDLTMPLWFKSLKHDPKKPTGNEFFTPLRIENAKELMFLLYECAETAGFRQYLFPGFGTLLGIIREGSFIPTDRDMDHCIMGSKITKEQEERFLIEVAKKRKFKDNEYPNGLFTGRKREPQRRKDNSRFLWFSCGHKKPSGKQTGCKSCVWKFFDHAGYSWHSKGGMWVKPEKFSELRESIALESDAVGKGISSEYLQEFTTMTFQNIEINVPVLAGHCLDAWYSSWARPRKGCSEKKDVLLIPDWSNKKSWKML